MGGGHLYGFPVSDSDFDLRGARILLLQKVIGLGTSTTKPFGIHWMRSGEIEANLVTLNESFQLPYIPDLVTRRPSGPEKFTFADADVRENS